VAEAKYVRDQNEMEISKAREMAEIETTKFKNMVDAIGANTLQAIATAGPEMQVSTLF
jgi:major vault protein